MIKRFIMHKIHLINMQDRMIIIVIEYWFEGSNVVMN